MTGPEDSLLAALTALGWRLPKESLQAFLTHAHQNRLGPTQTLEQLIELERRSREATNLARRTRAACLGSFKPVQDYDWSHPRKIDRPLLEHLLTVGFVPRKGICVDPKIPNVDGQPANGLSAVDNHVGISILCHA